MEGESGILAALKMRRSDPAYNKTELTIRLPQDGMIRCLSAETPERMRGPNLAGGWLEETGSWRSRAAWDDLFPALRRGDAKVVISTTPRPTALIKEFALRTDGTVAITHGSTFDNAANLSVPALDELRRRWAGTRRERQELFGELLEDTPGALWTAQMLDDTRGSLILEMSA